MLLNNSDPIIAIATATGRGAVGIVRISGANLTEFVQQLCRQQLTPRVATYLPIRDMEQEVIDRGLAIYFPAPHSYTGEDVLELQIHGGPVVLQLLLAHCLALAAQPKSEDSQQVWLPHLRSARPGEFTERAFLNAKLDLAQAEAVADLIDASTAAAAKSAGRSLSGAFSNEVYTLREQLINLRMLVEATLDFPEEEIDFLERADAVGKLNKVRQQLQQLQQSAKQGALLREGIKVVIAGQPNAGKSSLLNQLAGQELAIVTPIAGTTRDKVSQTIQIAGVPLHIIDTAGLRNTGDEIEKIGIERAWNEIKGADVILFMHDLTQQQQAQYRAEDAKISSLLPDSVTCLHLYNKTDLVAATARPEPDDEHHLSISANSGAGIETLKQRLLAIAGWQAGAEGVFLARERHLQAIAAASIHLELAQQHLARQSQDLDLLAEELRLAQNQLNQITGEFNADDLLGEIFSKFCIGK